MTSEGQSSTRPIDRARVGRMIVGALTGDLQMTTDALNEAFADDFNRVGWGAVVNVLRLLLGDLVYKIQKFDEVEHELEYQRHWILEDVADDTDSSGS